MVRRLTEKPFPIRSGVSETGANTFTQVTIHLPIAPVLGKGKLQAVELMTVWSEMDQPDPEADQNNRVTLQLTKDSQTVATLLNNSQTLWKRRLDMRQVGARTAEATAFLAKESVRIDDVTDRDGNGIIIAESAIHLAIIGVGNAAAKSGVIVGYAHLVELDSDDAITLLLEAD